MYNLLQNCILTQIRKVCKDFFDESCFFQAIFCGLNQFVRPIPFRHLGRTDSHKILRLLQYGSHWFIQHQHDGKIRRTVHQIPRDTCDPPGKGHTEAARESSVHCPYKEVGEGTEKSIEQSEGSCHDTPEPD